MQQGSRCMHRKDQPLKVHQNMDNEDLEVAPMNLDQTTMITTECDPSEGWAFVSQFLVP